MPALRRAAKQDAKTTAKPQKRWKRKGRKSRLPNKEEFIKIGEMMGVPASHSVKEWEQAQAEISKNGGIEPKP